MKKNTKKNEQTKKKTEKPSRNLTRAGYIRHLDNINRLLRLVHVVNAWTNQAYPKTDAENDRAEKITKTFIKLEELIWETGAVCERIHRERVKDDPEKEPEFSAWPLDENNDSQVSDSTFYHGALMDLEKAAFALMNDEELERTDNTNYPGETHKEEGKDDREQLKLGLREGEGEGEEG